MPANISAMKWSPFIVSKISAIDGKHVFVHKNLPTLCKRMEEVILTLLNVRLHVCLRWSSVHATANAPCTWLLQSHL